VAPLDQVALHVPGERDRSAESDRSEAREVSSDLPE
jgi:hypothetical protein